jgi:adenine/guanine/hypoxanthine permease
LSNVLVAALFLVAVFFAQVATAIPGFATAPALILVGALMMQSVARVNWNDFSDAFPAFVTVLGTPLTFSIAFRAGAQRFHRQSSRRHRAAC